MKKILFYSGIAASLLVFGACSDERDMVAGEGNVIFSTSFSNDVKVASRATLEEELSESCLLWISSEKGLVRQYKGLDNVPTQGISLVGGNYVAEAWAGDSVSASFDKKYYKGRAPFTITSGTTRVDLKCNIANVVTSVRYAAGVDEVLSDYTMTVGHRRGSLTFEGRDERKGYFMMPTGVNVITWKLTGRQVDGTTFTKEGEILDPQGATEYILNVLYTGSEEELGAGYLTIEVDDKTIDIEDNIVISAAPEIKGVGFDIANPVYGEEGKIDKKSVYISAAAALTNVVVESDNFSSFLSGPDVDLMTARDNVISTISAAGIDFAYTYNKDEDISNLKLNFNELFTNSLTGENSFVITATDANGKSTVATLVINVTDAAAEVIELSSNAATTWATRATVSGSILKADSGDFGFDYRVAGASEWEHIDGLVSGSTFSAELTDLTPGTTYEYRVTATDFVGGTISRFTTEAATQLPNSGFENWSGSKPSMVYGAGEEMFWDTGNTGSAKMGRDVTIPSSDYTHSGTYSAKLESQYVGLGGAMGAFAAGNMFVGKFLDVESVKYGILGWGRQFTSRPKALKGYIKYIPQPAEYAKSGKIEKGEMDQGIIYIAIVDNSTMSYSNGKYSGWPQIVATKDTDNYLFSKDQSNVIGYGEMIWTEATPGDGMVEFEIPIEYFREDIKASNIILTCSASRYGDYYAGGPSVMYIDDFELVY